MRTRPALSLLAAAALMAAPAHALAPGDDAPPFILRDHLGQAVNLGAYQGQVVVLEFTNPDCPFVKRHYRAGTMKRLAEEYGPRGVVWLTINSTHYQDVSVNRAFVEQHDLPQRVLDDHSGATGRRYEARTTPHMYVLDADHKVAYLGAIDDDPHGARSAEAINYVAAALDSLLAGQPVAVTETKPYGCSVKYARGRRP